MPLTSDASGVFPIAPTPFNPDGSVDWHSADRLFEFYHGIGADGTTVLGIMGEAPKLEPEESVGLVKRAVAKMAGKPIIVGVSAPGWSALALVYLEMSPVILSVPCAPQPLAWTARSGMRSRFWCASFSMSW